MDQNFDQHDLVLLLDRFPENAALIKKLVAEDEDFREVCEHYTVARNALARFEGCPKGRRDVEIADYRQAVPELEQEISTFIRKAADTENRSRYSRGD